MPNVTSCDGTRIAYDYVGNGPPLVIVGAAGRSPYAPLAALLARHFTVYSYDHRGHGGSGYTLPYGVEREYEDLAALLDEIAAAASVYGVASGAILALNGVAYGLPVCRLAIWNSAADPTAADMAKPDLLAAVTVPTVVFESATEASDVVRAIVAGLPDGHLHRLDDPADPCAIAPVLLRYLGPPTGLRA
jgi:pimeloyl-ACP methyl ester carboxylesterase